MPPFPPFAAVASEFGSDGAKLTRETGRPKISVCLTHYDRPDTLRATLASLAEQTLRPDEVLVWDDHSPRDPEAIVQGFRNRFSRLVYHRNERNLGMPGNLNAVIAQASGDYIANLHDADVFHPRLLDRWRAALDAYPTAGFVFCRVGARNAEQERRLRACPAFSPGREFNRRYFLNSWRGSSPVWGTVMARRALYRQLLPFDARYGCVADVDMWMRFCAVSDVAFVNEVLIEADASSHFVRGVNWSLVHALRRLHAANVARYAASTGCRELPLRFRHVAVFLWLAGLCIGSLARRGHWSNIPGAWRVPARPYAS
jgi:glycosyltransferase involved in cell wall biosynthesis